MAFGNASEGRRRAVEMHLRDAGAAGGRTTQEFLPDITPPGRGAILAMYRGQGSSSPRLGLPGFQVGSIAGRARGSLLGPSSCHADPPSESHLCARRPYRIRINWPERGEARIGSPVERQRCDPRTAHRRRGHPIRMNADSPKSNNCLSCTACRTIRGTSAELNFRIWFSTSRYSCVSRSGISCNHVCISVGPSAFAKLRRSVA